MHRIAADEPTRWLRQPAEEPRQRNMQVTTAMHAAAFHLGPHAGYAIPLSFLEDSTDIVGGDFGYGFMCPSHGKAVRRWGTARIIKSQPLHHRSPLAMVLGVLLDITVQHGGIEQFLRFLPVKLPRLVANTFTLEWRASTSSFNQHRANINPGR